MRQFFLFNIPRWILYILILFLLGCQTIPQQEEAKTLPETISGILVLPPINQSTSADAPDYYISTVLEPVVGRGYYVLPIEITTELLKQEGVQDGAQVTKIDPKKFRSLFGADAVLFVTIQEWDTAYYVLGGHVSVSLGFRLVSTTSGNTLWEKQGRFVQDTTNNNQGSGLVGAIINTAIQTALQDYIPVAQRANSSLLIKLPEGKYISKVPTHNYNH
jgi:hypothetical protein